MSERASTGLRAKHNQASAIVADMSLEEKSRLCSGANFWHLEGSERHDLPRVMVTDGPHGLRKQDRTADHVGLNASVPATCFPTACALASSWDPALLSTVGAAIGQECAAQHVAVLLGPGMNIKRHPLCGRNFEYFSEDPLLSGQLAEGFINGVQSQGVGTSVKHFAVNNQEQGRMIIDAVVDERTLREIYLRGFEIAIKKAQPWTVMCAYNRVNGSYCADNHWLLQQVLRDEWGFEGLVVTDWGATNDRVEGIRAGLDLEMPGSGGINDERVHAAVESGDLDLQSLDACVTRNVSLSLLGADLPAKPGTIDLKAHHDLARNVAAECTVLLKNDHHLLPLRTTQKIAVIGAFAQRPRYQGTGSSQVNPTRIATAWETLQELGITCAYAAGYDPKHSEPDAKLIAEAVAAAQSHEVALVFAGLPGIYESEGFDRPHMRLPDQHNALIEAVCTANPNTVVVLHNGAPVAMPWVDQARGIVEAYLGGQAGGAAVIDILFGRVNPSAKLAETFPLSAGDVASDPWFPGDHRQVQYREGLYVGYRYFDSAALSVLFPFGHGLSYTGFRYTDLQASTRQYEQGGSLEITLQLENYGRRVGSEIVQLYVHDPQSSMYRPEQELKAFRKVSLTPGEVTTVTFELDDSAFAVYDPAQSAWLVESGAFQIRVGASSRDIRLGLEIEVQSTHSFSAHEDLGTGPNVEVCPLQVSDETYTAMLRRPIPKPEPRRPFHMNSSLTELSGSWLGRAFRKRVVAQFMANMGGTSNDETLNKMFTEMVNNMPLRALALFSAGKLGYAQLDLTIALLNHQYLHAAKLWKAQRDDQRTP